MSKDKEFEEVYKKYEAQVEQPCLDRFIFDYLYPYKERCEELEKVIRVYRAVMNDSGVNSVNKIQTLEAKIKELEEEINNHEPEMEGLIKKNQTLEAKVKELGSRNRILEKDISIDRVNKEDFKTLEALLIEACELIEHARPKHSPRKAVAWWEWKRYNFKNKPEIKKILEGGE